MAALIQTISVVVAAISVIVGITAWRRSLLGQRRVDLAENVYEGFLQARDAITQIRSPVGLVGEGGTRLRADNETPEEAQLYDRAFVAIERFNNRADIFTRLEAQQYRFAFYFGDEAVRPFREMRAIIAEIFSASRRLRRHWMDQGRAPFTEEQFQQHLTQMRAAEGIFWEGAEDPDPLNPRIEAMVADIRATCAGALNPRHNIRTLLMSWREWFSTFFRWE